MSFSGSNASSGLLPLFATRKTVAQKLVVPNKHDTTTTITKTRIIANNIYFICFEVIGCILEFKSLEFGDFNDKINGFDFTFELEYELECDALPSPANKAIGTMPRTLAPTFNSTPTGVESCQKSAIGCDLIAVLSATTIATIKRNKNENELKYNTGLFWRYTQAETAPIIDRIFNLIFNCNPIGVESSNYNDIRYICCIIE